MTPKTVITDRPVLALDIRAEPGDLGIAFHEALAGIGMDEVFVLPSSATLEIVEPAAPEEIRAKVSPAKTTAPPSAGEPDQ